MKSLLILSLVSTFNLKTIEKDDVVTFMTWAPVQFLIHEHIHVMTVGQLGHRVTKFEPYPHKVDGHWYAGIYANDFLFESREDEWQNKRRHTLKIFMAPYVYNLSAFLLTDLLVSNINVNYKWKRALRIVGMLLPLIDTTNNYVHNFIIQKQGRQGNDFRLFEGEVLFPLGTLIGVGWTRLYKTWE